MTKVLLVDDERTFLHALSYNLKKEGYEVLTATDGSGAITLARTERPELIVLDLMLPGMSGIEVCRAIRADASTPILMLTARSEEVDKVLGLEMGADDYVVKPVGLRELMARINAILRRVHTPGPETEGDSTYENGPLRISAARHEAFWNGEELTLAPREFDLLYYLAVHEGRVSTRDGLLSRVWGYDHAGDPRTVDVHIRWLREKIEADPANPKFLHTVRGVGYKLTLS